jgi:hypothetical protein
MMLAKIRPYNDWVSGRALRVRVRNKGNVLRIGLNGADMSKQQELMFWVACPAGSPDFSVGLRDTDGHTFAIHITNGLDKVDHQWSRVRVPLKRYAVTDHPNTDVRIISLADIFFVFHAPADFLIDHLAFTADDILPAPPENVALACIDGMPHVRWSYSVSDDVVGYHCWRHTAPTGAYLHINTTPLSAVHSFADPTPGLEHDVPYYYAVQCFDRNQNYSSFSSDHHPISITLSDRRDLDWSDGLLPNTLGGYDGFWGPVNIDFVEQEDWQDGTRWLRTIEANGRECGSYITLNNWSPERYEMLSFWIKTTNDLNDLFLGLKSVQDEEIKHALAAYSENPTPGNWQHITMPLSDFTPIRRKPLDNLSFTFASPGKAVIGGVKFE